MLPSHHTPDKFFGGPKIDRSAEGKGRKGSSHCHKKPTLGWVREFPSFSELNVAISNECFLIYEKGWVAVTDRARVWVVCPSRPTMRGSCRWYVGTIFTLYQPATTRGPELACKYI